MAALAGGQALPAQRACIRSPVSASDAAPDAPTDGKKKTGPGHHPDPAPESSPLYIVANETTSGARCAYSDGADGTAPCAAHSPAANRTPCPDPSTFGPNRSGPSTSDSAGPRLLQAQRQPPLAPPVFLVVIIRAYRKRQFEERLATGPAWQDWDIVFPSARGTPWDGTNVTHAFVRRAREAGLPPMRFHDLRHGAASLMLAQGITLREIMEQLGHSQISLTANLYTHVAPDMKRRVAAGMDALFATR